MSAYENVDRQHHQQHVNKTAAKFRAPTSGKLRRKQRKWRVLLSIGLLLPALAAVIGIVAWAISIEVSNSDRAESQALSSSNQHRKLHQNQLHLSPPQKLSHFHPFRRSQPQQQQQQPEEASAPVASPVRQARTPEPETGETRAPVESALRRRSQKQQQQQQQEVVGVKATTKSESFGEERRSAPATSTLLLTNLGQVEALSGSASTSAAQTSTSGAASSAAAVSADDDVHERPSSTTNSPTSTTTTSTTTTTTSTAAPAAGTGGQSSKGFEQVASEVNSDEKFEADCEKSRGDADEDEQDNEAQKMLMFMMMSPKNVNHKSRFLSGNSKTAAAATLTNYSQNNKKKLINLSHSSGQQSKKQQQQQQLSAAAAAALAKQITTSFQEDPTGLLAQLAAEKRGRLVKSDANIAIMADAGAQVPNLRYVMEQQRNSGDTNENLDSASEPTTTSASTTAEPEVVSSESPLPPVVSAEDTELSAGNPTSDNPQQQQQRQVVAGASPVSDGSGSGQRQEKTPAASTRGVGGDKSLKERIADDELSFELIASAISTSLNQHSPPTGGDDSAPSAESTSAADAREQSRLRLTAAPLDGDTSALGETSSDSEPVEPAEQDSSASSPGQLLRRRTAGEHVAEVIDHIVERRRQAASAGNQQRGPQIVVVAPVGGDSMKARSLTKASATGDEQLKASIKNKPQVVEGTDKRTVSASSKKDAIIGTLSGKKQSSPAQTDRYRGRGSSKPLIGARLLGTLASEQQPQQTPTDAAKGGSQPPIRYSERVEVIEDDDSSAFLMKNMAAQSAADLERQQQQQVVGPKEEQQQVVVEEEASRRSSSTNNNQQQPTEEEMADEASSSIHVSSHSGEPRSRSPRHELNPSLAFERFAKQTIERRQQPPVSGSQVMPQVVNQQHQQLPNSQSNQMKLYSAEQLIRDHVLKSKSRPNNNNNRPASPQQQVNHLSANQQQPYEPQPQPHQQPHQDSQQQQPPQPPQPQQQLQQQPQQQQPLSHQHQVKVIPTTVRPYLSSSTEPSPDARQSPRDQDTQQAAASDASPTSSQPSRQQVAANNFRAPILAQQRQQHLVKEAAKTDSYQGLESQQQSQSVLYQPTAQLSHLYPQDQSYLAQAPAALPSNSQQQLHQQQQLPVFADQEYNVPAHMAESVIQNIQRAPPTFNMVNGQPTLISVATGQVPFQPTQQTHLEQLQQQPTSPQQALYLASQQYQGQQQMQHLQHHQQQQAYNQAAFLARYNQPINQEQYLQHQHQLQQPIQHQRQVIANREGGEPAALVVPVKKSMIHPVAQMALRHLFSSMGQQAQAQEEQQVASVQQPAATNQVSASATGQQVSSVAQTGALAEAQSQRSMVAPQAGAAPTSDMAAANLAPTEDLQAAGSRQMRSLTVGAGSPAMPLEQQVVHPQQQQQQVMSDQEVQESYNQAPVYHYGGGGPDGYGGGGGGYQSDNHDKKSKGLTFHFGGGPIGGGTQLITSPMGIFKHLMLPLMPNPLVHINGKVVFGVVLEKSTKIGSPPKKKYKFWGR